MSAADRQESLGLRGAVYKRRWQIAGQRSDLDRACKVYLDGYALGPQLDQGYTGINAAFILDLLALQQLAEMSGGGSALPQWTASLCHQATEIRSTLAALLPTLPADPKRAWLSKQWWFHATRAEACLGLGKYEEAIEALRDYNRNNGLRDAELSSAEHVMPWEFESTISQLAALIELQVAGAPCAVMGWLFTCVTFAGSMMVMRALPMSKLPNGSLICART